MPHRSLSRILLVEDDPDIQTVTSLALGSFGGFEVRVCGSAHDAVDAATRFRPDLILLDVMMPKLSGFDVCSRAKQGLGLSDVYIVLLTAKGQEFDRQKGQEVGADLYMTKPFDPDTLLQKARAVLGL